MHLAFYMTLTHLYDIEINLSHLPLNNFLFKAKEDCDQ